MASEIFKFVDSHTGGEPTRVITGGFPALDGGSLSRRLEFFRSEFDHLRRAIINEPRGFPAIVGALLCSPDNEESDTAVIFFNNRGYLGMCGHGTIGLVKTLQYLGLLKRPVVRIETVAGAVDASITADGSVSVVNVYSYRFRKNAVVEVPGVGPVTGDIAWGGNWFFISKDSAYRLSRSNIPLLHAHASKIMSAAAEQGLSGEDGAVIDHIELTGDSEDADGRNFVLCPGGEYDRSPCGTGTSAKLACLAADGGLAEGEVWRQEGICGSKFSATYRKDGEGIIPTITGSAHITAEGSLILDETDPFRFGLE